MRCKIARVNAALPENLEIALCAGFRSHQKVLFIQESMVLNVFFIRRLNKLECLSPAKSKICQLNHYQTSAKNKLECLFVANFSG